MPGVDVDPDSAFTEAFAKRVQAERDILKPKEEPKHPLSGLTEGRMVHYVLSNGEHRPAIVVKVWDHEKVNGCSNLLVFLDGTNDADAAEYMPFCLYWATSRLFSEKKEPATWHWIEKAD